MEKEDGDAEIDDVIDDDKNDTKAEILDEGNAVIASEA